MALQTPRFEDVLDRVPTPIKSTGGNVEAHLPATVVISHLRWDFVWQRPQHLLSRAAAESPVLFIEEPIFSDTAHPYTEEMERLEGSLIISRLHLPHHTDRTHVPHLMAQQVAALLLGQGIEEYVLWAYTPAAVEVLPQMQKPLAIVFDVMDELTAFRGASPALLDQERRMLAEADVVFTGGRSLFEAKKSRHANIHCFPSSIERAHFVQARTLTDLPSEYAGMPGPRLGFYGVIDERFDIDLLRDVAALEPGWQLVMLGPVVKIDPATLPQAANIHYLPGCPYGDLPAHLAAWDIALLPFALNESTRFISPTKTPEYLAAGKPTVSTPIADVVDPYGEQELVHIAATPEAFVAACRIAFGQRHDRAWLSRTDGFLAGTSWDQTWGAMARPHTPARAALACLGSFAFQDASRLVPEPLHPFSPFHPEPPTCLFMTFDYLIVGAGFTGCVMAERLARIANKKVLVLDKRPHIGGNAYDHYNDDGILIHKYGPHIFHTNSKEVFDYLGQFTPWRPYEHRVQASVDGRLVPMPINLDTVNSLFGLSLTAFNIEAWYESMAEPVGKIETSEGRSRIKSRPPALREIL